MQENTPDPRGRRSAKGRSGRSHPPPRQTPLCREAGSERESDGSGKRVEGEKEGSSFHLSDLDDAGTTTLCSILLEQGTPTVSVEIEGMSRNLIIDTGSNVSILQSAVSSRGVKIT